MLFRLRTVLRTMSKSTNKESLQKLIEMKWNTCISSEDIMVIKSEPTILEDEGIPFIVRSLDKKNLVMKKPNLKKITGFVDPFSIAYRRGEGSSLVIREQYGYALLFNKFSVMAHHMLLVPDTAYPQTDPLTISDFEQIVDLIKTIPSLVFYNCGVHSGASQPHKHIQFVPLESFNGNKLPIDPIVTSRVSELQLSNTKELFTLPQYHFEHRLTLLHPFSDSQCSIDANILYTAYLRLLQAYHLNENPSGTIITDHLEDNNESYNLLMTPYYMMLVPRTCDAYKGINVNSLGFAGSLVVTSQESASLLRNESPLNVLTHVCYPRK